jgi:hypothetical protein
VTFNSSAWSTNNIGNVHGMFGRRICTHSADSFEICDLRLAAIAKAQQMQEQPFVINKEVTKTLAGEARARGQDWNSRYGQLLKYKEKYGHCNVNVSHDSNVNGGFPGLGRWVSNRGAGKAFIVNLFITIPH